jgi:two-component system CheB/CheR fusion protein
MTPEEIAAELMRIARHPGMRSIRSTEEPLMATADQMNKLFILLLRRTGHDFSHYKPTTIKRRIAKRMMVHRVDDIKHYLKLLQKTPTELDALFQDLLINVTAFFRDPDVFDELKRKVLPSLTRNRPGDMPIRVWVPGCSGGQEVYTIAMVIHEYLSEHPLVNVPQVQIFGSDIDKNAIDMARSGLYPDVYLSKLPMVRRERYFHRVAGAYQVSKQLRDMCVFSVQNLIKDPPFSHLDIVSCRNLLIYFNSTLQKKVLSLFHYALQPGGFLLLGTSESTGGQSDLFATFSKKHKIYQKKAVAARIAGSLAFRPGDRLPAIDLSGSEQVAEQVNDLNAAAERALLDTYAPPGVLVAPDLSIVRYIGRTWPYIEPASGTASLNLYKNAHPDIVVELRAVVHNVGKSGSELRKDNVRLVVDGEQRRVDINVVPVSGSRVEDRHLLVMFEPRPAPSAAPSVAVATERDDADTGLVARNTELEREITNTREYMQSIVEEQEATNEELRSANEEIQSTNEELQSTNEELETAKEELQSANEELATVNEELETRNRETDRAHSDLVNLLASINIPVVILGPDLRIRQFTRPAEKLLNLIDADIGRPIGNIRSNIEIPDLESEVLHVIDAMEARSMELQDADGNWYSVRLRPYRTLDKRIDGAVVTFIDISNIKAFERSQADLENERRLAAIVRDSTDAILLIDFDGTIQAWNPAAERLYGYSESEALGMNVRRIVPPEGQADMDNMLDSARRGSGLTSLRTRRLTRGGDIISTVLTASVLADDAGRPVALATVERAQTGR